MSSKKTHITDTDGIKVFPETTIDQIFEPNGTDKFKVVQEFTEAEWDAKSDTEKAKIPLAKVLKKFVQRASAILYKDGKSVESALDTLNNDIQYKYFDTVQANAVLSLPTKFNELYVAVGDANFEYIRTFVVPYALLNNSNKNFYTGNYVNSSNNSSVCISVNRTHAQLLHYFEHSESFLNTAYMAVFYK